MLTKLRVRNFKRLDEVEVALSDPVVFVGPNDSGRTSALQALALWHLGLRRWNEKRAGRRTPERRPGVTINRRDLVAVPVPAANLLWRDLRVRHVRRMEGRTRTTNVRIDVVVDGVGPDGTWSCGLEFDYANEQSFYCRPLRTVEGPHPPRMEVPAAAAEVRLAFLPPMSGLAASETRLDRGAIDVRIGEGRTAEVLRNLCYLVHRERPEAWEALKHRVASMFGAELEDPTYVPERGEVAMAYRERGHLLDLSSSGRGMQQVLLLAYMAATPEAVLLLDEPDAHLEILRQREVYRVLGEVAEAGRNQLVIATHSEVLLEEAVERDLVVAFVGRPHRLEGRGSQVRKALREIGYEDYLLAETTGWVLYLEGSTDLSILQALARRLGHEEAAEVLVRPFPKYVGNDPNRVRRHFHALREAVPELVGVAIFDRLDRPLPDDLGAVGLAWRRREIESYLCVPETLDAFARAEAREVAPGPMFVAAEEARRSRAMADAIREVAEAMETLGKGSPWSADAKVSDDFLAPLFANYRARLGVPDQLRKGEFHRLAAHVPVDRIDPEVREKLDAIVRVARAARPRGDGP